MSDILISKSHRRGFSIISANSEKGTRWVEKNMKLRHTEPQVTVDNEGLEEIIELMHKEGLTVDGRW